MTASPRHRLPRYLALAVTLPLAAGCSAAVSSNGSASPAPTAGSTASPSPAATKALKAADYVLGHTSVLAGFTATSPTPDPTPSAGGTSSDSGSSSGEDPDEKKFEECIGSGGSTADPLSSADSDEFSDDRAGAFVSSSADVYANAADVRADVTLARSPQLRAKLGPCMKQYLVPMLAKETGGGSARLASTTGLNLAGAKDVAGAFRFALVLTVEGRDVPLYLDLILQGRGRVESSLIVGHALTPFDAANESALASEISAKLARQ